MYLTVYTKHIALGEHITWTAQICLLKDSGSLTTGQVYYCHKQTNL